MTINVNAKQSKYVDLQIAGLIIEPTESAMPNPNLDLYRQVQKYKIPTILFTPLILALIFLLTDKRSEAEEVWVKSSSVLDTNILGVFQMMINKVDHGWNDQSISR